MDASHINFKDENEKSCSVYLSHVYADSKADYGYAQLQYGPENIDQFTTDTDETFHATHTTGILAAAIAVKSMQAYAGILCQDALRKSTTLSTEYSLRSPT